MGVFFDLRCRGGRRPELAIVLYHGALETVFWMDGS